MMKKNLLFDFSVDKARRTIHVTREFNADVGLVWKAWTTAELLDQWWAPSPWRAETKVMDFRKGGMWLYAMVGPGGEKHWSRNDYTDIVREKSFSSLDSFSDENGTINHAMPQTDWTKEFSEADGRTTVEVNCRLKSLEDLEKLIEMGFQEGFTQGLNQLEELLGSLQKN